MRRLSHEQEFNTPSSEVKERALRMVQEHQGKSPSLSAAVVSIALKTGCVPQTLLGGCSAMRCTRGTRVGVTTSDAQRMKEICPARFSRRRSSTVD